MWLSGCSGCHMSFLDLDERLVGLVKLIDILFSPIVDTKVKDMPQVDVGIVEGCVNNTDQEHELQMLRDRCKILIALGDCACTGNIPALRNQFHVEGLPGARLRTGRKQPHQLHPQRSPRAEAVPEGAAAAGGGEGGPPHPRLPAGRRRDLVRADGIAGRPHAAVEREEFEVRLT